jgi:MoaA/NifB/PqqE/SkfB family radical SAM enzyme
MKNELSKKELLDLLRNAKDNGLKWVYTCGLGEPLEDDKFWSMLDFLQKNNIKISLFTNGLFIKNIDIAKRLKDSGAFLILKMDTFIEDDFDMILGTKGAAKRIYKALDYLINVGYGGKDEYTDLAFSIVPTSLSFYGIPQVIDFAIKNKIFPSVGDLEKSGLVLIENIKKQLTLQNLDLNKIKSILDYHFEGNYKRPICPAIITGLHFNNLGECIVDKETGLNCKWFLLQSPNIIVLGYASQSISELFKKVRKYRADCFTTNKTVIDKYVEPKHVFGGCGGNISEIFSLAKECL